MYAVKQEDRVELRVVHVTHVDRIASMSAARLFTASTDHFVIDGSTAVEHLQRVFISRLNLGGFDQVIVIVGLSEDRVDGNDGDLDGERKKIGRIHWMFWEAVHYVLDHN